jgi:ATP-dependent Lon protease
VRAGAERLLANKEPLPITIDVQHLEEIFGAEKYLEQLVERENPPGVSTGLAWTPLGGEILFIESTRMPGTGKMTVTGQLGDVMKESAQAALGLIRWRAKDFGINEDVFAKNDIHVHFPAGAIPKDGPSAGITMASAMISRLTGIPIRKDVAMTGEITLTGRVLPIGGLKDKALAAMRHGIKTVIIPEKNKKDLEDIPEEFREKLDFIPVKTIDDVLDVVLTKKIDGKSRQGSSSSEGFSRQGGRKKATLVASEPAVAASRKIA